MKQEKTELSKCCSFETIPPDWEGAERMGSLWRGYVCYICKKCHKDCEIEDDN